MMTCRRYGSIQHISACSPRTEMTATRGITLKNVSRAQSNSSRISSSVKKLIEDEDPAKPLTDEQITRILQSQGIQVTRRTVAKYREDMKIPSTHQRRVKK